MKDLKELILAAESGSSAAIGKLLTILENSDQNSIELEEYIFSKKNTCKVIGLTGAPGAGKSTLLSRLALELSKSHKVAVIAVDPSSPYTGGAVLGDRIRFQNPDLSAVYFRSMAARGSAGGLAVNTGLFVQALAAFSFEYCLIETVGVGQAELDVAEISDTCIVVLVPGMGDEIQAMKAGILEIADIFLINKADYPAVDSLHRELLALTELKRGTWKIPIVRTVASEGLGIGELLDNIKEHQEHLITSGEHQQRRLDSLTKMFKRKLAELFILNLDSKDLASSLANIVNSGTSPSRVASLLLKKLLK